MKSSEYSFLKNRQVVALVFVFFICICVYLYSNILFIHIFSKYIGLKYESGSYFNLLHSLSDSIISFIGYNNVNNYLESLVNCYNSYILSLDSLYDSLYSISYYFMYYNSVIWFDTCGLCKGQSNLNLGPTVNVLNLTKLGILTSNISFDSGCFMGPSYGNAIKAPSLFKDEIYHGYIWNIGELYSRNLIFIQNYLNLLGYCDSNVSSVLRWKEESIFNIVVVDKPPTCETRTHWHVKAISGMSHFYNVFGLAKSGANVNIDTFNYNNTCMVSYNYLHYSSVLKRITMNMSDACFFDRSCVCTAVFELSIQYTSIQELYNNALYNFTIFVKSFYGSNNFFSSADFDFVRLYDRYCFGEFFRLWKKGTTKFCNNLLEFPIKNSKFYCFSRYRFNNFYNCNVCMSMIYPYICADLLFNTQEYYLKNTSLHINFLDNIYRNDEITFSRENIIDDLFLSTHYDKWYAYSALDDKGLVMFFLKNNLKKLGKFKTYHQDFYEFSHTFHFIRGFDYGHEYLFHNINMLPKSDIFFNFNPWHGFFEGLNYLVNGFLYVIYKIIDYESSMLYYHSHDIAPCNHNYDIGEILLNNISMKVYSNSHMNINLAYNNEFTSHSKFLHNIYNINSSSFVDIYIKYIYNICSLFLHELDVSNYFIYKEPYTLKLSNFRDYDIFIKCLVNSYPLHIVKYGFGLHNIWSNNGFSLLLSKYLRIICDDATLLSICSFLKTVFLFYPVMFILLSIALFIHIIYAYEFLFNDYLECSQFRIFTLNIVLVFILGYVLGCIYMIYGVDVVYANILYLYNAFVHVLSDFHINYNISIDELYIDLVSSSIFHYSYNLFVWEWVIKILYININLFFVMYISVYSFFFIFHKKNDLNNNKIVMYIVVMIILFYINPIELDAQSYSGELHWFSHEIVNANCGESHGNNSGESANFFFMKVKHTKNYILKKYDYNHIKAVLIKIFYLSFGYFYIRECITNVFSSSASRIERAVNLFLIFTVLYRFSTLYFFCYSWLFYSDVVPILLGIF